MDHQRSSTHCPDVRMSALMAAIGVDASRGMHDLDNVLHEYPLDARLHFLKGSLLAGAQDFTNARLSMRQAVDLAPDYHIARFQLGFLLLTSGEPHAAQEAWGPLHSLSRDNYLHVFVKGLCHLIKDEFAEATEILRDGIARNSENPAMNSDMQLILDQIRDKSSGSGRGDQTSSVDFLLQQAALKPKH